MRKLTFYAVTLFFILVPAAQADVDGIPSSATWYFHADFDAMRDGKASRGVYDWLDAEVFEEVRGEIGIDFDKEARSVTAFSGAGAGPVIILDGKISQDTRDKILALAAMDGELKTFKSSGKAYYFFDGGGDGEHGNGSIDVDIGSLEDEAYVSVAIKNKILITNTQEQMKTLLANNGKTKAPKNDKNALFVLRAERSLIQAGVQADEMEEDSDWDSKILRNTKQVALLMADLGERLGIEAQLVANEPDMANSLASVVRGLIGLTAFSDEMDEDVAAILQSTTVDVVGSVLKLSLSLDPDTVVSALED
ncbi:MAG: hypothetical protein KJO09_12440 [Gammaproteobacteria bacterium]|nr:hypothetical protein [Gammaproteobacteria bacterium]